MPEFKTIGKYEVLDIIGEGGFGVVYKARDPVMERHIAIKVCLTEDDQIRKRFLREAKIAGGLDHPNIVIAYDFGTEENRPYLVQELLSGEDLRITIDRKVPIVPEVKIDYLVQIAKALQYAHAQGVLHRDIKPANVRVLDDGRVKLMDFGMAKITKESGTRLTQDGSVMGTAGYFAPEQLKALDLDQRVDIFSFGVVAYELLTFNKAFPGDSFMVVFRQVLHDQPVAIASIWPECPTDLADLVGKCLQKEPDARFESFDEILPILFSLLSGANFDRRAHRRESTASPELAATVLKPVEEIASPGVVGPTIVASPKKEIQNLDLETVVEAEGESGASSETEPLQSQIEGESDSTEVDSLAASSTRPRKLTWLMVSPFLLLVAAVAIWLLFAPSKKSSQSTTGLESAISDSSETTPPAPSAPLFAVFVDATPWGEISQIVNASGEGIAIPDSPYTPSALWLPAGSYVVTVTNPYSGDSATCQVQVPEDASQPCKITFAPLDAIQYFKQTGWWE